MNIHGKAKSKVLQEIMALMDEHMSEGMKSKSPKFAKVDIKANDPELAEDLKEKLMGDEVPEQIEDAPPMSEEDEDMERLKELYESLK